MERVYIDATTFDKNNFTISPLIKGEYESCVFKNCDFSNTDLSNVRFLECTFICCNLSLAKLTNTAFIDVSFKDCKMLGLVFHNCDKLGLKMGIDNCVLDHSSFYQTKIRKTTFRNSRFNEVDFTECDLTASVFDNCDLMGAKFENTVIEKVDFRTAFNYTIDPGLNRIKRAKFSMSGIAGLLDKFDIEITS